MAEITGLSILIPVFNYDIRNLVKNLSHQSQLLNISVEIICIDDKSDPLFLQNNREIQALPFVKYSEEKVNRGRSAIRNFLASKAQYNHLIFLDCDSTIVKDNFLQNYITGTFAPVKVGGTVYSETPPDNPQYILHWLAGSKKEVKPPEKRKKSPYHSLTLNNIFIQKNVYQKISLDENIKGYGHEDTKFGFELMKNNIPILHIDNPVLHEGLSETSCYLEKTRESVQNLYNILLEGELVSGTKLVQMYLVLKKVHCRELFLFFVNLLYPLLIKNLQSKHPSLLAFDIYKLRELVKAGKNNAKT